MARYWVRIALIIIVLGCLLLAAGYVTTNHTQWNVNVTGRVMNDIGQPAVNVNVTLWLDGKIVNIPGNPQLTKTGWNGDEFQPYDPGSFTFDVRADRAYKITCEKDGYYGETTWDPANPIPAFIIMHNPNMTASDTTKKYGNVSDSQIEEAKAIAFNNQSIRQMLDGINYSIEYVTTASDGIDPLVMQISVLIGNYSSEGVEITSQLLVCVDLSHEKIVAIQHSYAGSETSNLWIREIPPGDYVYSRILMDDVNGSSQQHKLTVGFTCMGDLAVRPMLLDAANFKKFTDGEPYDTYLFGNETVSSDWSKSLTIPSNRELYFVVRNERADQAAKIDSNIDLTV